MKSKYSTEALIPHLRKAAAYRNDAVQTGLTDNAGAIHSATRILDLLCPIVRFGTAPSPSWKKRTDVEISAKAHASRERGDLADLRVEHVMPQRAYAVDICERIASMTDDDLVAHIKGTYRIVLLTQQERSDLDRQNRSKMTPDRIAEAGIILYE